MPQLARARWRAALLGSTNPEPLLPTSTPAGINTAIYSPSGANTGVGFAIPVDIVRSSVDQIVAYGRVVRPVMGISFAPDTSVEQLGVSGVLVLEARDGGPAGKAGVKGTSRDEYGRLVLGDVIMAIGTLPWGLGLGGLSGWGGWLQAVAAGVCVFRPRGRRGNLA